MDPDLIKKIIEHKRMTNEQDSSVDDNSIDSGKISDQDFLNNLTPEQLEYLTKMYTNPEAVENAKQEYNKNFKSFTPEPGKKEALQGLCLKTTNSSNKEKIFLNICKSDQINAPPDISEEQLIKLIDEDVENSAFHYRVPMSIGEAHSEIDNNGSGCVAYDICINPEFLKKITDNSKFMGFFMSIVIDGIEAKYNVKLDKNIKMMKNKKFHGTIKEQYIRTKSKPLIAEVKPDKNDEILKNSNENKPNDDSKTIKSQTPKYRIFKEPPEGKAEFLVAEVELPNIISAKSVNLDIGEDRILLNTRSGLYLLDIYLPYNINQEESGAQFDKKTKVLTITLPVV